LVVFNAGQVSPLANFGFTPTNPAGWRGDNNSQARIVVFTDPTEKGAILLVIDSEDLPTNVDESLRIEPQQALFFLTLPGASDGIAWCNSSLSILLYDCDLSGSEYIEIKNAQASVTLKSVNDTDPYNPSSVYTIELTDGIVSLKDSSQTYNFGIDNQSFDVEVKEYYLD
jgi:hypothetical protein